MKIPHRTKETVEIEVRRYAQTFTAENQGSVGPPLVECLASGLYYLIKDGSRQSLRDPLLLQDPDACWKRLLELEAAGDL